LQLHVLQLLLGEIDFVVEGAVGQVQEDLVFILLEAAVRTSLILSAQDMRAVKSLVMLRSFGEYRLFEKQLALVSLLCQLPFTRPFSLALLTRMMVWLAVLSLKSNLAFRTIHLREFIVQIQYRMQSIVHQLTILLHYQPFQLQALSFYLVSYLLHH